MPPPHRFPAEETEQLLRDNFGEDAVIAGVDADLAWSAIRKVVSDRLAGGLAYDAVIAWATFRAGAGLLLTWNPRDFLRVAPEGLEVLTPAQSAARGSRVH
jgi:predicted nucleic acid-binding protein